MKKWAVLLLMFCLTLSFGLVGCGSSDEASSDEAPAEETVAAESDFAYLEEKGTVVVGITLFAPMNYYNDDNELIGFDTELAEAVFEEMGLTPEFVEINWDAKEIELNSKNIDCIWNAVCITDERKENMSMTDPYLNDTLAMVMKTDREEEILENIEGINVVSEQGSTCEGRLLGTIPDDETVEVSAPEFFKGMNYTAVDSMAKALMEVKAGTADVAFVDSVCALAMVREDSDYSDLTVNLDYNFGAQQYGVAFRKGSDVPDIVNQVLDIIFYYDGTTEEIAKKYGLEEMLVK